MEQETMVKKDGVRLVRKRLKEFLKPLGFQQHSTNQLIRVRERFIDMVELDTASYHLDPLYYVYYRSAPFTRLHCDSGRLWRTAKENISTHLRWNCEIPPHGGPYYYKMEHFEAVWRDVSYVLNQHILPQMEAMTPETFLSRLIQRSQDDRDLFLAYSTVHFDALYFDCMSEAVAYGVGMWRMEQYEEGIPYLTFARQKYREWLTGHEENPSHRSYVLTLELMDRLLAPWEKKRPCWTTTAQKKLDQVELNWADYMR